MRVFVGVPLLDLDLVLAWPSPCGGCDWRAFAGCIDRSVGWIWSAVEQASEALLGD